MLKTQCPTCEVLLETDTSYNGKSTQCPECEEPFTILPIGSSGAADTPAPTESVPPVQTEESPEDLRNELLGASESAPSEAVPIVAEPESAIDAVEARPLPGGSVTPRRPQRSKTPIIVGSLAALLLLAFVLGVVMNSGADKPVGSSQSTEGTGPTQDAGSQQASAKTKQGTVKTSPEQRSRKAESSYAMIEASFDPSEYEAIIPQLEKFIEQFPDSERIDNVKKMLREAKAERNRKKTYKDEAEKLYSDGKSAFERKDYEAAVEKLSRATTEYAKSAIFSQAKDLLKKVETEHAEKLYKAGKVAYGKESYRDAMGPFEQLVERYPQSESVREAKKCLREIDEILVERIASNAWVVYGEHKRLKQAGWVSDETRELEEIALALKWSFPKGAKRLSKGAVKVDFKERKGVEDKTKYYVSNRAREQIGEKEWAGDKWLTVQEVEKRGYIRHGNRWFKLIELLEHQVMKTPANTKFFALRRKDMFDTELAQFHGPKVWKEARRGGLGPLKDRKANIRIFGYIRKMLYGFRYGVSKFQPDSDKIAEGNNWVAAKATVTVSYQLSIPIYKIGKIIVGQNRKGDPILSREDHVIGEHKRIETISRTYVCVLIRESEAIQRFLKSRRQDGVPRFKFTDGLHKMLMDQSEGTYYQSACFWNSKSGFVIAVIYMPEFKQIFHEFEMYMNPA